MRTIVFLTIVFALLLIGLNVGLQLMQIDGQVNIKAVEEAQKIVNNVGEEAWRFSSPLLQLIIVFLILQWLLSKSGLDLSFRNLGALNVQILIAILIIATFCISALGNLPGLPLTKDLALIVIGFYFGTRTKNSSTIDPTLPGSSEGTATSNQH